MFLFLYYDRVLAKKNKHGVSTEVLEKRVKLYQKLRYVRPMYFGWFLSEADSKLVMDLAYQVLVKVQETSEDFRYGHLLSIFLKPSKKVCKTT